jgi:hypothetical protein
LLAYAGWKPIEKSAGQRQADIWGSVAAQLLPGVCCDCHISCYAAAYAGWKPARKTEKEKQRSVASKEDMCAAVEKASWHTLAWKPAGECRAADNQAWGHQVLLILHMCIHPSHVAAEACKKSAGQQTGRQDCLLPTWCTLAKAGRVQSSRPSNLAGIGA